MQNEAVDGGQGLSLLLVLECLVLWQIVNLFSHSPRLGKGQDRDSVYRSTSSIKPATMTRTD
jgi:hypothetical protein